MAETGTVFTREVTCAPEPMAIIATDQQLLDLERFPTNRYNFCVMGIDPGGFTVTATVYRHLLVEDTCFHTSSILPGPNLVQQCMFYAIIPTYISTHF